MLYDHYIPSLELAKLPACHCCCCFSSFPSPDKSPYTTICNRSDTSSRLVCAGGRERHSWQHRLQRLLRALGEQARRLELASFSLIASFTMAPTQAIYAIHSTELASSLVPAQDNAQDTAAQPLSSPSRRVPRSTGLYGASDPYFLDGARKKYATDRNILRRSAVSLRASWTPDGTGTLGAQLSRRATLKPNSTQRVTLGVSSRR